MAIGTYVLPGCSLGMSTPKDIEKRERKIDEALKETFPARRAIRLPFLSAIRLRNGTMAPPRMSTARRTARRQEARGPHASVERHRDEAVSGGPEQDSNL